MQILETTEQMRAWSFARRAEGRTIGVVPTMGALHEGHASLMRASVAENDVTVLTLFVNPAQFAPHEDFDRYPRTFESDCAMAKAIGVDAVYAPDARTMYPAGYSTYVDVENLKEGLCGGSRPHFFRGVATVVTKLFNATVPDRAYFGQKDGQQAAVIRRMVRDLDFGIEIRVMPIVREADGLAMSSRNAYLSAADRQKALAISRALFAARARMEQGERDARIVIEAVRDGMRDLNIDYVSVVNAETMAPVERIAGTVMLAAAAWLGETRLIDNITVEVTDDVHRNVQEQDSSSHDHAGRS
jgi:pantoate--beta-alanine ligase